MAHRREEIRAFAEATLLDHDVEDYEFSATSGGHQKVVFRVGGQQHTVYFPSTPSDGRRARLNMRSLLIRKVLGSGS